VLPLFVIAMERGWARPGRLVRPGPRSPVAMSVAFRSTVRFTVRVAAS
jgi:hypothetical protein